LYQLEVNISEIKYPASYQSIPIEMSFKLKAGEVALIRGASGSGKTSVLRCLNRVIPEVIEAEYSGDILWGGTSLDSTSGSPANSPTTFTLLQNPFHSFIGTGEILNSNRISYSGWMMQQMRNSRSFHDLSAGERQRMLLKRAFQAEPDILLLDEPASRLDEDGLKVLNESLAERKRKKRGITIIAEHRWDSFKNLVDAEMILNDEDDNRDVYTQDMNLSDRNDLGCQCMFDLTDYGIAKGSVLISLQNVGARISGKWLFRDVNLELRAGEVIGITGPNGSGKTTLGKLMVRKKDPSQGKIVRHNDRLKSVILYEDPQSQLLCDTVREEVSFAADNYRLPPEYPAWLMKVFGLESLKDKSPFHLSHGQQERTVIAAILSKNPELVVLDESTQGQDKNSKERLTTLIRSLSRFGKGVLLLSQDREFLNHTADMIFTLKEGRLERMN